MSERLVDAVRRRDRAGLGLYVLTLAVVALGYYVVGRIGLELAYLNGAVAALWPPAGFGLAVLVLYGVRLWPAIVVGDLFLSDYSTPLGTVLAQTFGNTVALVVAALLMRRLTGGRCGLERVADVLAFVACALVAAVVSAAFGPLSLRLGDVISAMIPPASGVGGHDVMEVLPIVTDVRSAFYLHLEVADTPGVLAQIAELLGMQGASIKSVVQRGLGDLASGSALGVLTTVLIAFIDAETGEAFVPRPSLSA